jgi:hypothetical protein
MFKEINKKIQEFEYDESNSMPYYPMKEYLNELKKLMNIDAEKFKDFHYYVQEKCFATIEFCLSECKEIPSDIKEKKFYRDWTVKQFKEGAESAILRFKVAIEYYKPTKEAK